MAVFVDNSRLPWRGQSWCHLVADSVQELHTFADQLGLKRAWFQEKTMYPHYDVTVNVRVRALQLGAQPGDKRTIISCAKRMRGELVASKLPCTKQSTICGEFFDASSLTTGSSQQVLFAA